MCPCSRDVERNHSGRYVRLQWGLLLLLISFVAFSSSCSKETGSEEDSAQQTETAADSSTQDEGESDEEGEAGEDDGKETRKPRETSTTVNAAKVIQDDLVVPVVAEGSIRARRSANIRTEISGRIERIFVEEGQQVRKGQRIAALDGREYAIAIEEARSRYLNALGLIAVEEDSIVSRSRSHALEEKLQELGELEERGKISREERRERELTLGIEQMREGSFKRELIEARSGLSQARADEERAELNLERTTIRAPFDGVVSELTLTSGHNLTVGETICKLVDNIDVEAEVGVLESDLAGLEVGRPALLIVPALEETLQVKVDVISPEIDPDSRTCTVLMRVRSEEGRLRPGMFVRAAIAGRIYPDKLLVPNEAILTRDGRPLLFKVEDDRAKWVYLKLGLRNDRFVEIERVLQGGPLDPDMLVVVSDHLTLTHDAKIKVRRVVDNAVAWASSEPEE